MLEHQVMFDIQCLSSVNIVIHCQKVQISSIKGRKYYLVSVIIVTFSHNQNQSQQSCKSSNEISVYENNNYSFKSMINELIRVQYHFYIPEHEDISTSSKADG